MVSQDQVLPRLLFEYAARHPEKVAIRQKALGIWEEITWQQYAQQVRHLALGLYKLGVRHGDRVALMADNSAYWLIADLAIQSIGAVSVGIYPTLPEKSLAHLVKDSGSTYFIVGNLDYLEDLTGIARAHSLDPTFIIIDTRQRRVGGEKRYSWERVITLGKEFEASDSSVHDQLLNQVNATDVGIINYTSGTTGLPKGIKLEHRTIVTAVDDLLSVNPLSENDVLVSCLPLCHTAERVLSVYAPLRAGHVVCFPEDVHEHAMTEALFEISPTVLLGTPRLYEKLASKASIRAANADKLQRRLHRWAIRIGQEALREKSRQRLWVRLQNALARVVIHRPVLDKLGLRRVRLAFLEGGAASPQTLAFFELLGLPILEAYGGSEYGGIIFCQRLGDRVSGTVGKPLPSVEFKIADDGELWVRRKGHEWLSTGDVVQLDEQGNLRILGRRSDIYRGASGQLLSLAAVRVQLKASPYIREAVVIRHPAGGTRAYIEIDPSTCSDFARREKITYTTYQSLTELPRIQQLIAEELQAVNEQLDDEQAIIDFVLLPKELSEEEDLLTPNGKVKEANVLQHFADKIAFIEVAQFARESNQEGLTPAAPSVSV